ILQYEFEKQNTELHFVTEQIDDSMEGQLVATVKAIAAKIEKVKIIERTMRGKRTKLQEGKLLGMGFSLYGYRFDKESRKREIVEEEAKTVQTIFQLVTEKKLSLRRIAKHLNNL